MRFSPHLLLPLVVVVLHPNRDCEATGDVIRTKRDGLSKLADMLNGLLSGLIPPLNGSPDNQDKKSMVDENGQLRFCRTNANFCGYLSCLAENFQHTPQMGMLNQGAKLLTDRDMRSAIENNPDILKAACDKVGLTDTGCQAFKGFLGLIDMIDPDPNADKDGDKVPVEKRSGQGGIDLSIIGKLIGGGVGGGQTAETTPILTVNRDEGDKERFIRVTWRTKSEEGTFTTQRIRGGDTKRPVNGWTKVTRLPNTDVTVRSSASVGTTSGNPATIPTVPTVPTVPTGPTIPTVPSVPTVPTVFTTPVGTRVTAYPSTNSVTYTTGSSTVVYSTTTTAGSNSKPNVEPGSSGNDYESFYGGGEGSGNGGGGEPEGYVPKDCGALYLGLRPRRTPFIGR